MKKSEFIEGLAKYLVKRDEHLALNITQARQLAHYATLYVDKHMTPPKASFKDPLWEKYKDTPIEDVPMYVIAGDPWYHANEWEDEDENDISS